jgi:hypothetical protein
MTRRTYAWQERYIAAVRETDDANTLGLILEAASAIEQRLLLPLEPGSDEDRALKIAQRGLATLRAERCADQNQKRQRGCDPQSRRTLTGPRYHEGEAQNEARALADRLTASGEVPQVIVEHIGRLERDREFVIPLKKR